MSGGIADFPPLTSCRSREVHYPAAIALTRFLSRKWVSEMRAYSREQNPTGPVHTTGRQGIHMNYLVPKVQKPQPIYLQ